MEDSKMKLVAKIAALSVLVVLFAASAGAEVLLTEDFSSGSLDAGKWLHQNVPVGTGYPAQEVQDTTGGFALRCKSYAAAPSATSAQSVNCLWNISNGGTAVFSQENFLRGDNLRITYRIWHAGDAVSGGIGGGCMGGFYFGNDSDTYNRISGILSYGYGNYGGFKLNDAQNAHGSPYDWGTAPTWDEFNTAFPTFDSQANSALVRITLGNTSGAMIEASTDDGATWPMNVDHRDAASPGNDATTVLIGFGALHGTSGDGLFIDDIVVENDAVAVSDWDSY